MAALRVEGEGEEEEEVVVVEEEEGEEGQAGLQLVESASRLSLPRYPTGASLPHHHPNCLTGSA